MTVFQAFRELRDGVESWPLPLRWLGWACFFSAAYCFAFYALCLALIAIVEVAAYAGFPGLRSAVRSDALRGAFEWGFWSVAIAAPGALVTYCGIGVFMVRDFIRRRRIEFEQRPALNAATGMGIKLQRLLYWTITGTVLVPLAFFGYTLVSGEVKAPRIDLGMLLFGALMTVYATWWAGAFIGAAAAIVRNFFPE